jgi:hypothetical protein
VFLELVYEGRRRNTNGERGERGEGRGVGGTRKVLEGFF